MRTLIREWSGLQRNNDCVIRIVPLGDVHIGSAACDEKRLQQVVDGIAEDDDAYWLGMGDYAEFINRSDRRFDPAVLASWIDVADLVDLPRAQRDRFLSIIKPIAGKCLGLIEGNHEQSIKARFERDIYSEIVSIIKSWGGFEPDHQLAFGMYGYLRLVFKFGGNKRTAAVGITGNVHHGFTGGRLGGAKALNMERWLWTHDADFVVFGHSHNADIFKRSVEGIDRQGNVINTVRRGGFSGTFMRTINPDGPATYSERRGYLPLPLGGICIEIRPGMRYRWDMVRMWT